jgi:hypothetical protein
MQLDHRDRVAVSTLDPDFRFGSYDEIASIEGMMKIEVVRLIADNGDDLFHLRIIFPSKETLNLRIERIQLLSQLDIETADSGSTTVNQVDEARKKFESNETAINRWTAILNQIDSDSPAGVVVREHLRQLVELKADLMVGELGTDPADEQKVWEALMTELPAERVLELKRVALPE